MDGWMLLHMDTMHQDMFKERRRKVLWPWSGVCGMKPWAQDTAEQLCLQCCDKDLRHHAQLKAAHLCPGNRLPALQRGISGVWLIIKRDRREDVLRGGQHLPDNWWGHVVGAVEVESTFLLHKPLYLHLVWGVRNRAKSWVIHWEDKPCLCFVDYKKNVTLDKGSACAQGHGERSFLSVRRRSFINNTARELPGAHGGAVGLVLLQGPAWEQGDAIQKENKGVGDY